MNNSILHTGNPIPAVPISLDKEGKSIVRHLSQVRNADVREQWSALSSQEDVIFVHAVRPEYLEGSASPLSEKAAEAVLATWDLVSVSLIDCRNINAFAEKPEGRSSQVRKTNFMGELAFILDVPTENIYGTHSADISVINHAGVENGQVVCAAALVDHLVSDLDCKDRKVPGGFSRFISPQQLLAETRGYNEVLIVSRNNVQINANEKATGSIKVTGILSARGKRYFDPASEKRAQDLHNARLALLKRINHGIPVINIDEDGVRTSN